MAYYPHATEFGARYSLVAPDGATAVFNDPFDTNYVGVLTDVTGLDSADVRESATDLTESDGGAHGSFFLGRRPIVLSGIVINHTSVAERTLRLDRARRASLALRGNSTLSWKPSSRRENLIINPSPRVNGTGWSSSAFNGVSITTGAARVAGDGAYGTGGAIEVVANVTAFTGSSSVQVYNGTSPRNTPVTPGQRLGVAGSFKKVSGPTGVLHLQVGYHTSAGAFITQGTVAQVTDPTTGQWYNLSGLAPSTVPSNAATAYAVLTFVPTANGSLTYRADAAMIDPNGGINYFDGESAGYHWQGDANVTPSGDFVEMYTPVRRQQPFRETEGWNKKFQIPLVSEYAQLFGAYQKTVATGVAAENRGNTNAYPIIRITGGSTANTVSDGTRVFRTTGLTLAGGEIVEFDMLNHTGVFTAGARVGQSANRYIDFATTAWPYLTGGPGATTTFTLSGGGTCAILYRDTWS